MRWVWWTALAVAATLAHTMIDAHIGLWGETSDSMSPLQAANIATHGALYAWWAAVVAFAFGGDRWALRSVLLMAAVHAFLLHGLVAFAAAPPPSSAFPYQDIAHGLSMVTGGIAALMVWAPARRADPGGRKYLFLVALSLLVLNQALSALTFAQGL